MKKQKAHSAKMLILNALLNGRRLTTFQANMVGGTTEGGRRIRELRDVYPIQKEQVPGERYCYYYLPADYIKEHKRPLKQRLDDFFDDLLNGGMFGR
jgi:hypothetical protein